MRYFRDDGFLFRMPDGDVATSMKKMEVWDKKWLQVDDLESRSHAVWFGMPMNVADLDTDQV